MNLDASSSSSSTPAAVIQPSDKPASLGGSQQAGPLNPLDIKTDEIGKDALNSSPLAQPSPSSTPPPLSNTHATDITTAAKTGETGFLDTLSKKFSMIKSAHLVAAVLFVGIAILLVGLTIASHGLALPLLCIFLGIGVGAAGALLLPDDQDRQEQPTPTPPGSSPLPKPGVAAASTPASPQPTPANPVNITDPKSLQRAQVEEDKLKAQSEQLTARCNQLGRTLTELDSQQMGLGQAARDTCKENLTDARTKIEAEIKANHERLNQIDAAKKAYAQQRDDEITVQLKKVQEDLSKLTGKEEEGTKDKLNKKQDKLKQEQTEIKTILAPPRPPKEGFKPLAQQRFSRPPEPDSCQQGFVSNRKRERNNDSTETENLGKHRKLNISAGGHNAKVQSSPSQSSSSSTSSLSIPSLSPAEKNEEKKLNFTFDELLELEPAAFKKALENAHKDDLIKFQNALTEKYPRAASKSYSENQQKESQDLYTLLNVKMGM